MQHSPTAAALSTNTAFELKMWFSCFHVLPGIAEAQVIRGRILKHLLIAYFIDKISTKTYQNLFMWVKVIANHMWDVSWDTVYILVILKITTLLPGSVLIILAAEKFTITTHYSFSEWICISGMYVVAQKNRRLYVWPRLHNARTEVHDFWHSNLYTYGILALLVFCIRYLVFAFSLSLIWILWPEINIITFRVSRRRREMYIGHARLCVCLSIIAFPHYCTDPDVSWGNGRGCPLVVTIWRICNRCTGFVAMTT